MSQRGGVGGAALISAAGVWEKAALSPSTFAKLLHIMHKGMDDVQFMNFLSSICCAERRRTNAMVALCWFVSPHAG